MKNRIKYSLLLLCIISKLFLFSADLKERVNFGSNPGNLKLFTFNDSLAKNKPIVFVLHGCVQNAEKIEELSDWKKAAIKNDFVVFYPQQKIINNASNCFNFLLESDINKNGECLSIYQMIRYAIDTLKVDSTHVFLYGASAGACMSEVVCANYPWLINTAAICGAIPYRTYAGLKAVNLLGKTQIKPAKEWGDLVRNQNTFYSGKYPRIILALGTEDFVTDYGYASEIIKQWTSVHAISAQPTDSVLKFENNDKVERYVYGKGKETLIFYKIKDVSHTLPVDVGNGEKQGGKDRIFSTDINFFLTYYIVKDFGLIK
ncbi:MAG: PHB depolymerase family esterase [Bacteroidetes bacterium]|nr:PHB depolymerase family esterase [Bacteroidota bacterium]